MSTQTLKITKDNIAEHLINKMFEIIGVSETYENLITTQNETWFQDYSWNKEQEIEFIKYAKPLIKKTYRLTKDQLEKELMWFLFGYGLKRNDYGE